MDLMKFYFAAWYRLMLGWLCAVACSDRCRLIPFKPGRGAAVGVLEPIRRAVSVLADGNEAFKS